MTELIPGTTFTLRLDDAPQYLSREPWRVDYVPADCEGFCDGCGDKVTPGQVVAYPDDPENQQQWHVACFLEDLDPYVIEL